MSEIAPFGRHRYRPLRLYLLAYSYWHPSQGPLTDRIPLDHLFLDLILKWWTKPSNVLQGKPLQAPAPQLNIFTDASTSGWGAHCGSQSAAGQGLATETARHISELEWLAIQEAVLHFLPLIRGSDVPPRQQLSSCLPTESERHSLIAHVPPNMGHPVLPAAWDHAVSATHSRSSECSSRQPVEKASDHRHRVVSAPQHSAPNVLHLVHSRAGPVCNSSQQQAGSICLQCQILRQ